MSPRRRKKGPLAKAIEMSIAAPQVIALRTSPLAIGRDPGEFARMGTEKVRAFQEAFAVIGFQIYRSNMEWALLATRQWWLFWQNAWRWDPFGWMSPSVAASQQFRRSAAAVVDRALAPAHRRVTGNLRRLSRAKKR